MQSGAFRGMHVIVYRGYVADNVAKVRVRVVEEPELPGDSRIPYWDVMQANLRRHGALAIVGVDVELRIAGHSAHETTDSRGFANFSLPVPKLAAGWHDALRRDNADRGRRVRLRIGPGAETSGQSPLRGHLRHRRHDSGQRSHRGPHRAEADTSARCQHPKRRQRHGLAVSRTHPWGSRSVRCAQTVPGVLLRLDRQLVVLRDAPAVHPAEGLPAGSDVPHRVGSDGALCAPQRRRAQTHGDPEVVRGLPRHRLRAHR